MLRKIQSHLFRSVWFRCLKTMGTEAMCRSQGLWWVRQFALTFFLLSLSHPGLALLAKILWSLPQMVRQDINRIRNIPVRHSWILVSRKMIVFWHKDTATWQFATSDLDGPSFQAAYSIIRLKNDADKIWKVHIWYHLNIIWYDLRRHPMIARWGTCSSHALGLQQTLPTSPGSLDVFHWVSQARLFPPCICIYMYMYIVYRWVITKPFLDQISWKQDDFVWIDPVGPGFPFEISPFASFRWNSLRRTWSSTSWELASPCPQRQKKWDLV